MATQHITSRLGRGFLYALTSTCSLFAGYLIQIERDKLNALDFVVLLLLSIVGVFFFLCYAERFPTATEISADGDNLVIRKEAIYMAPYLIVLVVAGAVSTLIFGGNYVFSGSLSAGLLLYCVMFFAYGGFLRRLDDRKASTIRHRLVWPVILSIGLNLYLGITFSNLSHSWLSIIPVLILIAGFFITNPFGKTFFLIFTLTGFGLLTVLTFLVRYDVIQFIPKELNGHLSTLEFCIIVSAYLSVFEAWPVTAEIAENEVSPEIVIGGEDRDLKQSHLYFIGTMTALMVSLWALPFFFIFSKYGIIFLVLFGLHAFTSFIFWNRFAGLRDRTSELWRSRKIWFGISFLAILSLTSLPLPILSAEPTGHTMPDFVSWGGVGILALIGTFPIIQLFRSVSNDYSWELRPAFIETINTVRLLTILSLVACSIILIFLPSLGRESVTWYKGELAFLFYGICISFGLGAELVNDRKNRRPGNTVTTLFALLTLVRIVPSLLIALGVFLPSLYRGNSVGISLLAAVPFFLAAVGGYAFNDYFDVEKDVINKPYRAIPSGGLARKNVLIISLLALSLSFAASIYSAKTWQELSIYLLCLTGVAIYNIAVKYLSLTKTALTALVSALPLLYSALVFGYPLLYLLIPTGAAFFVLGREWLMDVRDLDGDQRVGLLTFPMIIGPVKAARFGFSMQILGALLVLPLVVRTGSYFSFILFVLIVGCILSLFPIWFSQSILSQRRVIQILWAPMLFGILLFMV